MPRTDPVALLSAAIGELLTEYADKITEADIDELVELIVECVLDTERDRTEANLQKYNDRLSQFALRLRARYHRDTDGK